MFRPLALGHLQITKLFIRGNYTVCHKIYHSKTQQDLVVFQYSNAVHHELSLNFRLIYVYFMTYTV